MEAGRAEAGGAAGGDVTDLEPPSEASSPTPENAPASEPTEGMLGVAVVGGEVVRLADDLNMRTGTIVEITRGSDVANPADLPFEVSPNFHNR
eukprot:10618144-Alexandrium_andersonii.AAC.1